MQESEPGNIISPSPAAPEEPEQTPVTPPAPSAPQDDSKQEQAVADAIPTTPSHADDSPAHDAVRHMQDSASVSWRAAEYGVGVRSGAWYVLVVFGSALLSTAIYFLNRDMLTAILVLVALVGLAFATGKKPKQQSYVVDGMGITVGNRTYNYHDFHSFSVAEDAQASSIILIPLKRLMPAVNVYVPIEYEEQVVHILSDMLPMEHHKPDLVEKLTERLHF